MSDDIRPPRPVRLVRLASLFCGQPARKWRTSEIASLLNVSEDTALRHIHDLSQKGTLPIVGGDAASNYRWWLSEDDQRSLPPLRLDYAAGAALYAAARLLSQQQDEHNDAVHDALLNIISILPEQLQPHLEALVLSLTPEHHSKNVSAIFEALSQGWLGRRVVRLSYEPAHGVPYSCRFSPYLLEPSGIGRTLYFIGHSDPPGGRRTYKLERILTAELTDNSFEVPESFDGAALLRVAWGIMSGDGEPTRIRLRFSQFVSKRVRETMWHPSQQLTDTAEGLVWEADIGDLTEIRPWIRGWGADCEVLEPKELRDELMRETRRLMRLYSLQAHDNAANGPDQSLLDDLFGKD